MRQWVLKITDYADRLLNDLSTLDWPSSTVEMQKNWIGKSYGAEITFKVKGSEETFKVFTTRADTLYGCTYCCLAPEHPLVSKITTSEHEKEVSDYIALVSSRSDMERTELNKDKTGVFTGAYAVNPINGKEVPIYIADYVLASYGTGAVMAVPAHDERDYEFASKYHLPMIQVLEGDISKEAMIEDAPHINSEDANGLGIEEAKKVVIKKLISLGAGQEKVTYRLRDWLFSRQRYWGEPIPTVTLDDGSIISISTDELPLELPPLKEYKPSGTGESPLVHARDWLNVEVNGHKGTRETNTMPQWAGSCWYYIRYIDPHNDKEIADKKLLDHWLPVDLYIGGSEHAVLHLLYARFWHKFLYDIGVVTCKEPFQRLFHQGMILGENGEKMSKSKGNVVNPDECVKQYGADALRLYEMFMGPLEDSLPWSERGLEGAKRYLDRVYRLFESPLKEKIVTENNHELDYIYNYTVKKVTSDYDSLSFNTAISALMVLTNEFYKAESIPLEYIEGFIKLLDPIAPFVCEEIWNMLGHENLITYEPWPVYDESKLARDTVHIAVQVNGKLRDTFDAPIDSEDNVLKEMALSCENVKHHIEGHEIRKVIVVKNKIVNIVL